MYNEFGGDLSLGVGPGEYPGGGGGECLTEELHGDGGDFSFGVGPGEWFGGCGGERFFPS